MNVAGVYQRGRVAGAANHDALWEWLVICPGRLISLRSLRAPPLRRKGNKAIGLANFALCRPARRAVLAVADGLGFNTVEIVQVRDQRDAAENAGHSDGNNNQNCKVGHKTSRECKMSSFQSLWVGMRTSFVMPCAFSLAAIL